MAYVFWEKRRLRWFVFVEPKEASDGRRHWLSTGIKEPNDKPTRKGEEAARKWLQVYQNQQLEYKAAGVTPTEDKTVKQFCDEYLKARNKHKGYSREGDVLEQFIAFKVGNSVLGAMRLAAVKQEHVQAYLNAKREIVRTLKDGTTSTRKASPGNAVRHRITLRAVFAAAEAMKPNPLIPLGSNPVVGTVTDTYNDRRHRELKQEEQARMVPFCQDSFHWPGMWRLGRIITCALYSLMREEEIFKCRWRDIDLKVRKQPDGSTSHGVIVVASEGDEQTKDRDTRKVELYPPLRDLLTEMREEAMKEVGGLPAAIEDRHVFLTMDGTPYKSIKTVWRSLKRMANIRNLRFHDLRRTGAMRYHRLGVPITVLQTMLGHSDVSVTMRYLGLVGAEQSLSLNRAWKQEKGLIGQRQGAKPKARRN